MCEHEFTPYPAMLCQHAMTLEHGYCDAFGVERCVKCKLFKIKESLGRYSIPSALKDDNSFKQQADGFSS